MSPKKSYVIKLSEEPEPKINLSFTKDSRFGSLASKEQSLNSRLKRISGAKSGLKNAVSPYIQEDPLLHMNSSTSTVKRNKA